MNKPAPSGRSLSDLMPVKGAAARPETLPLASADGTEHTVQQMTVRSPPRRVKPEVRTPITVKIRESIYARLREATHREDDLKQNLIDEALDIYLRSKGY